MSKSAKYIVTTGGFDTDSDTLKEAREHAIRMVSIFRHEYAIYRRIEIARIVKKVKKLKKKS